MPGPVQALAVKPDGKLVAAAAGKSIKVWDLATGQPIKELQGHTGDVQSAAWRGDGAGLATGDKANAIRFWKADLSPDADDRDAERGRPRPGVSAEQPAARLGRLGRTGAAVAASGCRAPKDRRPRDRWLRLRSRGTDRSWRPRGGDKVIRIWNPADGKSIKEISDRCAGRRASRFSKTGRSSRRPWRTRACGSIKRRDGKEVKKIESLPAPISAIAFRGDGGQLAVAGEDNMIRVINPADGKTVKELKGHQGRIHALAYSLKDGNLLFSASADKTAKLWDVNQGKSVRDFAGHADAVI